MQRFEIVGERKSGFIVRCEPAEIFIESRNTFVQRFFHRFRSFIELHLRTHVLDFTVQLSQTALHFILIALHFKHELSLIFARLRFKRIDFSAKVAQRFRRIGALPAHTRLGIFEHFFVHGLQTCKHFFGTRLIHIERFVGFRLQFADRRRKSGLLLFHIRGIILEIREKRFARFIDFIL